MYSCLWNFSNRMVAATFASGVIMSVHCPVPELQSCTDVCCLEIKY